MAVPKKNVQAQEAAAPRQSHRCRHAYPGLPALRLRSASARVCGSCGYYAGKKRLEVEDS